MQVVIPMSGFGDRFRRAGYKVPKPLIEVDAKPIIAHVVDLFPGESDFTFICNREHLDTAGLNLSKTLKRISPEAKIIGIEPHKFGPVHAVRQAAAFLDPNKPVIVNYCDFTCYWNYDDFLNFVHETRCDGAIPAYKGFHPHSLGSTNYAYLREKDGWVLDIREKQAFTENRQNEYASSGTYFFSSAGEMLKAMEVQVSEGLDVNGEFYTSLSYKPLLDRGASIAVYPLQHFMQWGTPEDLREYQYWSEAFRTRIAEPLSSIQLGKVVVPMAGLGSRFTKVGIETPKPLLEVAGRPMMLQSVQGQAPTDTFAFVVRSDMPGFEQVTTLIEAEYPNAVIEVVDGVTDGQAISAKRGVSCIANIGSEDTPVTVIAIDHGLVFDGEELKSLLDDPDVDVVIWGSTGYPPAVANPGMYGWIAATDGKVHQVSVKAALTNPESDPLIVGAFTFRNSQVFHAIVDRMISRNGMVNGEFYLDECINDAVDLGYDCRLLQMKAFFSWGTPEELDTYKYWQSTFHKWSGHEYRIDLDPWVPAQARASLEHEFEDFTTTRPKTPRS